MAATTRSTQPTGSRQTSGKQWLAGNDRSLHFARQTVWPAHRPIRAERRLARSLAATANNRALRACSGYLRSRSSPRQANQRSAVTTITQLAMRRAGSGQTTRVVWCIGRKTTPFGGR
jgi:hypothetical protein